MGNNKSIPVQVSHYEMKSYKFFIFSNKITTYVVDFNFIFSNKITTYVVDFNCDMTWWITSLSSTDFLKT
jgi:hypothetical protein